MSAEIEAPWLSSASTSTGQTTSRSQEPGRAPQAGRILGGPAEAQFQPSLVSRLVYCLRATPDRVNRGEYQTTDLVIPAQNPIPYGGDFASGLTAQRSQQHRGSVENSGASRDEVNPGCETGDQEQRQKHKQVDSSAHDPSCPQGSRVAANEPPVRSQDRSRKHKRSYNHREHV